MYNPHEYDPLDPEEMWEEEDEEEEGGEESETPPEPPVSETPPVPTEETPPADPPEGDPETFPRDYVEKLRAENAQWRTKLRDFEGAFEGYQEDEVERYLELARKIADPDQQLTAAEEFEAIAKNIKELRGEPNAPATRPTGEEDPDNQPLTRAEWKRLQQEQDQEAQLAQQIKQIEQEATQLGVPPTVEINGETRDNPRYVLLLHAAQHPEVAGDLTKAADAIKYFEQDIIDQHVASVQETAGKFPAPPGQAPGAAPGGPPADPDGGAATNWKDARKGAMAFLAARAGK